MAPAAAGAESAAPESAADGVAPRLALLERELLLSRGALRCACSDGPALAAAWASLVADLSGAYRHCCAAGVESGGGPPAAFSVALARGEGSPRRLGLECATLLDHRLLLVTAVERGGLAEEWNSLCAARREPWRRLHPGTALLAVDGVAGDVRRMRQELERGGPWVQLEACSPPDVGHAVAALNAAQLATPLPPGGPYWAAAACTFAAPARPSACGAAPAADITVIVTTSPVPSNPGHHMLEHVLGSLQQVPGLLGAPRVLVCDGLVEAGASRKPQHKAGRVTPDDASRYREFVARVRSLAAEGEGPFADLQVVECTEHQGFGFAVKRALQEVRTAFVLVVQHDQEVVRAFDLPAVLLAMGSHPHRLKYVGLCSTTTRNYEAMVLSKYQIRLASTSEFGVPLVPLLFFYDKPHICSARHYREVVLGEGSPVTRGTFIEETLGQAQRADILQHGMGAHAKYGTYQLDERDGAGEALVAVRHVNGRSFLSPRQRVGLGWPACLRFSA